MWLPFGGYSNCVRPNLQDSHREPCHGAWSGDLTGEYRGRLGPDGTDLVLDGTYLEVWGFHTQTSCAVAAKGQGRVGGKGGILLLVTCFAAGPLAGHPLAW